MFVLLHEVRVGSERFPYSYRNRVHRGKDSVLSPHTETPGARNGTTDTQRG